MSGGRFQGDLPERTLQFALCIADLVDRIPDGTKGWVFGKQLARSGTSIGANVREADHALTDAEFVQRCSIARKEASETEYWLTVCERSHLLPPEMCQSARRAASELMRILSTIVIESHKRSPRNNTVARRSTNDVST